MCIILYNNIYSCRIIVHKDAKELGAEGCHHSFKTLHFFSSLDGLSPLGTLGPGRRVSNRWALRCSSHRSDVVGGLCCASKKAWRSYYEAAQDMPRLHVVAGL